ncbi:NADP-dependent malic enzyme [bacterium]|nr:NADP-dependent malic enzyme [bacterium]
MVSMTKAINFHKKYKGKLETKIKCPMDRKSLALAYTPGVGEASMAVYKNPKDVKILTNKGNLVAIVTDGTAVLGLGNIGPNAALPVMEGKAALFKKFANIDAVPILLDTQDTNEIINTVINIAPTFSGINLEDISAPRCFDIEKALVDRLDIPVFHDDQHGTAVVVLAALLNALKVVNKDKKVFIVISGAGAAGVAIAKILKEYGFTHIILVDSKGALSHSRKDLNASKKELINIFNMNKSGGLADVLIGADVFIGVSAPNIVSTEMVKTMNKDAIVFALSNPVPEILPEKARLGGARVIATGRSDFPNQINNVLVFPGIFRGALDSNAKKITNKMKLAAAKAIASMVKKPSANKIIPSVFEKGLSQKVAKAVKKNI